jgi:hypothetical protein
LLPEGLNVLLIEGRGSGLAKRDAKAARDKSPTGVEEAMRTTPSVEELLAQARKPAEDALRLHPVYRGTSEVKISMIGAGATDVEVSRVRIAAGFPADQRG